MKKVPVLFLMFNRPDVTAEAFKHIREYKPDVLYLAADGPRREKNEESLCEETRSRIDSMIDWECEVHRLYRTENLGCANGVYEAISWMFDTEEFGVIIEDDVVVGQDFFKFCEELLPRYANNNDVMMITSQFLGNKQENTTYSYGFSYAYNIWGWATWRRAWNKMDMTMSDWPKTTYRKLYHQYGFIRTLFFKHYYWNNAFKRISTGQKFNSWATRWAFAMSNHNGLSLTPYVNMSRNIGCEGSSGTHYNEDDTDLYKHLSIHSIAFPLSHPLTVTLSKDIKKTEQKDFIRIRKAGLKKIIKKKFSTL